jgi:hypothetical protein
VSVSFVTKPQPALIRLTRQEHTFREPKRMFSSFPQQIRKYRV